MDQENAVDPDPDGAPRMTYDEAWWRRTWDERRDALVAALGPHEDLVRSFSWRDRVVPGACAVTFPPMPRPARGEAPRSEWLTMTVGMSQPLDADEVRARKAANDPRSGRGYEIALLTSDRADWAPSALYDVVTCFTGKGAPTLARGNRVGFGLYDVDGKRRVAAGGVPWTPIGAIRALLVYPYLPRPFVLTSTGRTELLVGTAITQGEWDLAKATSSERVLLWLFDVGVGQRSDLERGSLTDDAAAMRAWDGIAAASDADVVRRLRAYGGRNGSGRDGTMRSG